MIIYKYKFEYGSSLSIDIPMQAKVLDVQLQNGLICMWVELDTSQPNIPRHFYVYGTGIHYDYKEQTYIGTVQDSEFVWHVFEG